MARVTKAILAASPNVVQLPTAASRRVNNNRFREQWKAGQAAREKRPWPGERLCPTARAAIDQVKTFDSLEQSPALVLGVMIAHALPPEIREKLSFDLAVGALTGNVNAAGTLSAVRFATVTIGDVSDLDAARSYIDRQEGR